MNVRYLVATLGSAVALLASSPSVSHGPQKELTVVSWGGDYTRSQMLAYVKPYRRHSGEGVAMETYGGGLDEIREQVETENVVWDVVDFEQSDLIQGCREGLLEEIDHGSLLPGDDGTPAIEDFIPGSFTECGVGQMVWATVVAYDNEAVGSNPPGGLADFFDVKKYPGKRGLRRDPRVIMEWALMADGVAPDKVYETLATEEGQRRAFSVLDGIKANIVWWKSGVEPVALLESGTVVMTSVWNGRMYRPIAEEGKPFTILWDGQIWDIDSWGVPKGSPNLAKALDFIRFSTGSSPLAEQTKFISYGPARRSAMALVAEATEPHLPTAGKNMANALQTDAEWWASHHARLSARFEEWLAAGGRGPLGTAR
ncbi:MAG: ABC transporter substrate-binding protein [Rhodospirillaceae bacterium]|nr:ABC transporter substrate-binding protein [Rhodospirillaceae bacterium]